MYYLHHRTAVCWSAYIALNGYVSVWTEVVSFKLPLPVCFGWMPVPPWLRGFILGCCGGVWRLHPWAPPIGSGRERSYVIHIVSGCWQQGEQAGNPIAAPLSSLDTAGGTTSGQTVRPITGPLQLSHCFAISPLCSALLRCHLLIVTLFGRPNRQSWFLFKSLGNWM
jgi:hypothetical protein